jgi:uncharacterized Tic20 family protein
MPNKNPGDSSMPIAMTAAPDNQNQTSNHGVSSNGRLQVAGLSETDRNFAIAMHLSPFAFVAIGPFAFLAPLVLWLVRKDRSTFDDDHGRETVNVMITGAVFFAINFIAGFVTLGLAWIAFIAWCVFIGIGMIRGAVASGRGEYFRYPMTIRLLK